MVCRRMSPRRSPEATPLGSPAVLIKDGARNLTGKPVH